jgi:hypothetical protein
VEVILYQGNFLRNVRQQQQTLVAALLQQIVLCSKTVGVTQHGQVIRIVLQPISNALLIMQAHKHSVLF